MILRKPYAFLIKYFRQINILLLLLVALGFYKNLQLYSFVKDYLNTGIYNTVIDSISNYANIYIYLAFFGILVICSILAYLLRYKDKPYISYLFILFHNLIVLGLFLYTSHYFTFKVIDGYNLVATRVVKDLLFISTIPYYPSLFILLIRSIGIDLKSFGFYEDKEFISEEEDREEVEVQVGFDKDRFIRKIKYKIRHFKYFFLEHKVPLLIVFLLMCIIFGFNTYRYFYVENRIYTLNEKFRSNNYEITVKNTYLTDKDFSGNVVSEKGRTFIILDLKIKNLLNISRSFDIEKMMLFVDDDYYVPTVKFNTYFKDMGNLYEGKNIKANETLSYILVYEINNPRKDSNFLLKYQDLKSSDAKLIRVKIKVLDISTFKTKGNYNLSEYISIPINEVEKVDFSLHDFKLLDSTLYRYQKCNPNSCPIYEEEIKAPSGYKILYLKGYFSNYSTLDFLNFMKKYGKIRYQKDGKIHDVDIKFIVDKDYQGSHIYLLVPEVFTEADSISIMFTIRTYQYFYQVKGE